MKLGSALYAGWVALVITGIVGGLGLAFQQPWLFPSLGPTIFIHTVTPNQEAARPWNTFIGHGIGAVSAFLSLALFGALHASPAMTAGHVTASRIAASALAVALTIGGQILGPGRPCARHGHDFADHAGRLSRRSRNRRRAGDGDRPIHLALRLGPAGGQLGVHVPARWGSRSRPASVEEAAERLNGSAAIT